MSDGVNAGGRKWSRKERVPDGETATLNQGACLKTQIGAPLGVPGYLGHWHDKKHNETSIDGLEAERDGRLWRGKSRRRGVGIF